MKFTLILLFKLLLPYILHTIYSLFMLLVRLIKTKLICFKNSTLRIPFAIEIFNIKVDSYLTFSLIFLWNQLSTKNIRVCSIQPLLFYKFEDGPILDEEIDTSKTRWSLEDHCSCSIVYRRVGEV